MFKKLLSSFLLIGILFFNNNYAQVSPKRGITYGKHSDVDLNVLKSGISWCYNWSAIPESTINASYESLGVEFVPMAWGENRHSRFIHCCYKTWS